MIVQGEIEVSTTPLLLNKPDRDYSSGSVLFVRPAGDISVGGPNVEPGGPFQVLAGDVIELKLAGSDKLFAVAEEPTMVEFLNTGI